PCWRRRIRWIDLHAQRRGEWWVERRGLRQVRWRVMLPATVYESCRTPFPPGEARLRPGTLTSDATLCPGRVSLGQPSTQAYAAVPSLRALWRPGRRLRGLGDAGPVQRHRGRTPRRPAAGGPLRRLPYGRNRGAWTRRPAGAAAGGH